MACKANHHRHRSPPAPNPGSDPATATPAILKDPSARAAGAQFAEAAGGTAAGCAAICCCCTCGLVNLLVLTVVRLPVGLCRNAIKKQRLKRRIASSTSSSAATGKGRKNPGAAPPRIDAADCYKNAAAAEAAAAEKEREMWAEFCNAGFWRSPSQRQERAIVVVTA